MANSAWVRDQFHDTRESTACWLTVVNRMRVCVLDLGLPELMATQVSDQPLCIPNWPKGRPRNSTRTVLPPCRSSARERSRPCSRSEV